MTITSVSKNLRRVEHFRLSWWGNFRWSLPRYGTAVELEEPRPAPPGKDALPEAAVAATPTKQ